MVAGVLELVHTMAGGLTVGLTLDDGPLATSTANAHAVDDEALLGLVAEPAGLVRAGGAGSAVDSRKLTEFPAANTENEAEHVRLLLLVKLLNVLVGSHVCCGLQLQLQLQSILFQKSQDRSSSFTQQVMNNTDWIILSGIGEKKHGCGTHLVCDVEGVWKRERVKWKIFFPFFVCSKREHIFFFLHNRKMVCLLHFSLFLH